MTFNTEEEYLEYEEYKNLYDEAKNIENLNSVQIDDLIDKVIVYFEYSIMDYLINCKYLNDKQKKKLNNFVEDNKEEYLKAIEDNKGSDNLVYNDYDDWNDL